MHNLLRFDAVKSQRQVTSTVKGASVQVCGLQRTSCLRGSNVPIGPRPVVCHAGEPQDPERVDMEDLDIQGGAQSMGHGLNSQPPFNARWEHDFHPEKLAVPINASSATSGMEAGEAQLARSPSPSLSPAQDSHYSIDPKGWYECCLFDVLQGAHINAQAASYFFSHLAVHDSWASPLTMDELLHTVRIADITGFALPPVIVAQLHNLVQCSGPQASQSSADPLLAAYAYDLPALLDMLQGMEVTPSAAWTDYALHAWLTAVGGGAGGQLSAAHVRSVMTMLEAIYVPGTEPSVGPQTPLPSAPPSQGREPGAVPTLGSGAMSRGTTAIIATPSAGSVRGWLDACLTAMLDSGALRHAHQREDLYEMLPHLATAPSAAMVERLYAEAWLPYYSPGGAASSEYIASMLWLIAASGAKLPPAVVQGELRALEGAILRIAWNDSSTGGVGARGSGGGDGPSSSSGNTADVADPRAAAAAALKAAFALPSSPGASDRAASSSPPPPPSLKASAAPSPLESLNSPPLSGDPPPLQPPPPLLSRPASGRRITPFGAYLALWAFHHYHYIPHVTSARVVGPILLAAAVSAGGGGTGRGLEPRQRCRVVRAVLMCFGSVPPQLFAKHDWSSLFRGWEILGNGELLSLLQDAAVLAHQRRRLRRRRGSDGVQGDGGAQLLRLSHLVAHVVQLAGWQRRLEHVGLSVAITSLAGLLAVLNDEVGDTAGHDAASESHTPPGTMLAAEALNDVESGGVEDVAGEGSFMYSNDGDGGGGSVSAKGILASPFAQGLLANWLGLVLPEIQDAIKHLTGDWGNAGRAAGGGGGYRAGATAAAATAPGGQKQHWDPSHQDPQSGRGLHGVGDGAASGGAVWHSEPSRPLSAVAVSAAAAADAGRNSGTLSRRSMPGLPPPVTAETVLAQQPPPPLMATELTWMLMVLRDTAAALDPRSYPTLHRTLMWAMQRLGSRAGKCAIEPEVFAFVPGMLVQMDTLGWVDVPLEWAHAVVEYPDAEGAWFRRLPWHDAMRAVLGSGQLVKRARAEVLRYHGAEATVIVINSEASEPQQSRDHQYPQQLPGDPPATVLELDSDSGRDHAAAAAALSAGPGKPRPSKAEALLAAAQRLRSHLIGLMSARIAACGVVELRQVALTWQVYGMTYDQNVLELMVGALTAALADGDRGSSAAVTPLTLGSVRDAAARLEMMCGVQQVAEEEVRRLFRPLRVYGL